MTTADLFEELPPRRLDLSQWFTPADLADRMARWCPALWSARTVLEPSAGSGALVRAVKDFSDAHVTAHELDPAWAAHLRCISSADRVIEGDYLAAPPPPELYDVAVMNPPYERGMDGRFLEKAMTESRAVVALVRLVALAGVDRHGRVWSAVGDEWRLGGLAILSRRPEFAGLRSSGNHGAKSDFAAVRLERYRRGRTAPRAEVVWW